MERIREMAGRITELSNEELETLRSDIVAEFKSLEDGELSAELVNTLTELADAHDMASAESERREAELAELAAAAELASSRILATEEPETEEVVEEVVVEKEEDDEPLEELAVEEVPEAELAVEELAEIEPVVAELPVELAVEETAELSVEEPVIIEEVTETVVAAAEEVPETLEETVTASASLPDEIEIPAENAVPATQVAGTPITITAGADIPGVSAGSELPNLTAVADALTKRIHAMRKTSGGDGEQLTIASFSTQYPEDRILHKDHFNENGSKIANVISPEAVTAAGGLVAPVEVRYDIFGLGSDARPVRDALAVFGAYNADRGGIQFAAPPALADLTGAVSLWTIQDDIDAATTGAPDPVKPCIRVTGGANVTVYTDAVPLCITFGNMNARAYPELVEKQTKLGMVQHARFAETRLLTRIGNLSTAVTTVAELGAARDILVAVDQAVAGYRGRHRYEGGLRAFFPVWAKNAIRADIAKQLPGDDALALADAQIDAFFEVRGVNVTYTLDGETGQIIGAQAAGALNAYPANVIWYLFAEGTFLFLDGGNLDIGLVRDSKLNGTNDYQIFFETFEGVAKIGIESLKVTTPVSIWGSSSATTEVAPVTP